MAVQDRPNRSSRTRTLIFAAVVVVVVVVGGYSWWSRAAATRASQAWTELSTAMKPAIPTTLDEGGRRLSQYDRWPTWRPFWWATVRLATGCDQRFVNRAVAQKELKRRIESYARFWKNAARRVARKGNLGLARAKETQGDLEAARKYYESRRKVARRRLRRRRPNSGWKISKQRETKLMFDGLQQFRTRRRLLRRA